MSQPKPQASAPSAYPVDVFAELAKGSEESPFGRAGAALLAAHLRLELGDKAKTLSAADVLAYREAFYRRCHMATTALQVGNVNRFIAACRMYGIECESAEYYQGQMNKLLPLAAPSRQAAAAAA